MQEFFKNFSEEIMKNTKNWITSPTDPGVAAYKFRKIIKTDTEIERATVSASALGIYALYVNGERVGREFSHPAGRATIAESSTRPTILPSFFRERILSSSDSDRAGR